MSRRVLREALRSRLLRSLRGGYRGERRYDEIVQKPMRSSADRAAWGRSGFANEWKTERVPLPNRALMNVENARDGGRDVSWWWDDPDIKRAARVAGSGDPGSRTRRQVYETMHAAVGEIGRRAVTDWPRAYNFMGLTMGHDRLYRRLARQISPLYRVRADHDGISGIEPTPLAYASYAGQQALRGAGVAGSVSALIPEEAE